MEKFINLTNDQNEKAIKVGKSVPSGSIGLSTFSINDITPRSNVFMLDLSETIPENLIGSGSNNEANIVYADELGFLRTIDGNYTFGTDNLSLSNIFLSSASESKEYKPEDLNPNDFAHYMYISKFFIAAPNVFSFYSFRQFVDPDRFKNLNIKVVDVNGLEYTDLNSGRKKYRLLLEPYRSTVNVNRTEIPFRVIVLFDTDIPTGLKLVYDKIESDSSGNMLKQELEYSESINAVKLFQENPEESFVIDSNYSDSYEYSVKKINQKYADLIYSQKVENGYQVITNKKGIADYRTFEIFNWRLIARTKKSINFESLPEDQLLQSVFNTKTLKVGVLYSSNSDLSSQIGYPKRGYIFHNLERSPFNRTKINFINPITEEKNLTNEQRLEKNKFDYWLVDIDSEDFINYDFDILAWAPGHPITLNHSKILQLFTSRGGTLLLDLSSYSGDAKAIDPQLSMGLANFSENIYLNTTNAVIDPNKNGGWLINGTIFEKPEYTIIGSTKTRNNFKSFKGFLNYSTDNSFVEIDSESSKEKISLGILIPVIPNASELIRGNIVATTFPLMEYCNSLFRLNDDTVNISANESVTNIIDDSFVYSGITEGPFKLLFNICSFAAYCKLNASKEIRTNSSIYNFVTDWNSGWVMNKDALLDDEKVKYFQPIPDTDLLGVNIINSSPNVFEFYKSSFRDFLPDHYKDKVFGITESDVEFFIEVTNKDVLLSNCYPIDVFAASLDTNIPTSYHLFKVQDSKIKVFAYTEVPSPSLVVPDNIGPYSIIEKNFSSSNSKLLKNNFNIFENFKSYPFKLSSNYTYSIGRDKPADLNISVDLDFTMIFKGSALRKIITYTDGNTVEEKIVDAIVPCESFYSAVDDNVWRATSSSMPNNTFIYSGDIDIHKDPRQWKIGSTSVATATTTVPTTVTTTVPGANQTVNTTYNISLLSEGSVKWMNGANEPSALTRVRQFFGESYATWMKNFSGKTVRVFSGSIYYGNTYTVHKTTGTNYLLYKVSVSGPDNSRLNPVGIFANPEPKLVEVPRTFQTVVPGLPTVITETVNTVTTTGSSNRPQNYVKYIQYTLAAATGLNVSLDGIYGNQTTSVAKVFQTNNKQRYLDGSVDSETKAYMALYWKNLKRDNSSKYQQLYNSAPLEVKTFINAIETYGSGRVSEIGTKTYKKLTFSGFGGPNEAKDFIFFRIPNNVVNINKIIIEADSNLVWQNFYIDIYGYSSTDQKNIFKTTNTNCNKQVVNGKIELNFNGISASNARYMWISVVGKPLTGFGYAEGFSIKKISVDGKVSMTQVVPGDPIENVEILTEDIWAKVTVSTKDKFFPVTTALPLSKTYSTTQFPRQLWDDTPINSYPYFDDLITIQDGVEVNVGNNISKAIITSMIIGDSYNNSFELEGSPLPDGQLLTIDTGQGIVIDNNIWKETFQISRDDSVSISFDFASNPELLRLDTAVVAEISSKGNAISELAGELTILDNTLTASSSAVFYSSSGILQSESVNLNSGYRVRTIDGYIYPYSPNAVNISDGVLLFCNPAGEPIGFPATASPTLAITLWDPGSEEVDFRYGTFNVVNEAKEEDGFTCGFYDISQKEFLGKTISYIEYVNRGPSNIFIGVCAFDLDGNTQTKSDFLGPRSSATFKPVNIPLKLIAPIFSVKTNSHSNIRINQMDPFLSRFDAWELPVSTGSFWKDIQIDKRLKWSGWKSGYVNQTLSAFYSTFDQFDIPWSKIYGTGHYDIKDESPILIDDRTIQLRKIPLMSIVYPTDNFDSVAGVIKQELSVYTRASVDDSWQQVSHDSIRDLNAETGIVKFKSRIVPSNKELIKVSYTTSNKNNLIRQINGAPLPLNPMLNSDIIDYDQPLYIYLMPVSIYKHEALLNAYETIDGINSVNNGVKGLVRLNEYLKVSPINFTYDSALFDKRSSKYDPFALPIAVINVTNNPFTQRPDLTDIRLRGGGLVSDVKNSKLDDIFENVLSFWDVYPPSGHAYARGGYVVIRIPESVKQHFLDEKEIYQIVQNNLTAGVAFELQDMSGKSWS